MAFDVQVLGQDCQYIVVKLMPGEKIMAEPGALMALKGDLVMETVFGSGDDSEGVFGKLLGAGKRMLAGEKISLMQVSNPNQHSGEVYFSAPYPGNIRNVELSEFPREGIVCQKGAYLCGSPGTQIKMAFQKKLSSGIFGGEGWILQKLTGSGQAFIHAGGALAYQELEEDETLLIDTGSFVAMDARMKFEVTMVKGFKNMLLGHEGLAMIKIKGAGGVWMQSLPFTRLAGQVLSHLPESLLEGTK